MMRAAAILANEFTTKEFFNTGPLYQQDGAAAFRFGTIPSISPYTVSQEAQ